MSTESDLPSAWVGHVVQPASDPKQTLDFYVGLGLRAVHEADGIGIVELRGGTHIVFTAGAPEAGSGAPFDLMVADLDAARSAWRDAGAEVSSVTEGTVHRSFTLTDPDGVVVNVSDSHVIGAV